MNALIHFSGDNITDKKQDGINIFHLAQGYYSL